MLNVLKLQFNDPHRASISYLTVTSPWQQAGQHARWDQEWGKATTCKEDTEIRTALRPLLQVLIFFALRFHTAVCILLHHTACNKQFKFIFTVIITSRY